MATEPRESHNVLADFWPGTVSGLLVKRKCTARRASPRSANTLTSLDPVLKMNAPATSVSHDRPNHLALSDHREAARDRDDAEYLFRSHKLNAQVLGDRFKNELRHNLIGNVEWHDKTLELWIEIFESQT